MAKVALITGITGQDGSYLAEYLLREGYEVYGLVRRLSTPNTERIDHILDKIELLEGDTTDQSSLNIAVQTAKPDEVYHLAAQSFVATSWNQPVLTADVTGLGTTRILEAILHFFPDAKMYQASSSEMFGATDEIPQTEKTQFRPRSPYAVAKVFAYYTTINYRESYGMYCANGILFNHESPRRGIEFVTRKITDGVAKIYYGLSKELRLGNLAAKRDWGYAGDYVEAMQMILQYKKPDDFVIATGESHSVKEFVELAFHEVGLDWQKYVVQDKRYMRPADVENFVGNASKARKELGWKPRTKFKDIVKMMVQADLEKYQKHPRK